MTAVTAQALESCGKSHGKERLKRKALRRPRKTLDVTHCGRLFQVRAAATGKARPPMVASPCNGHSVTLRKQTDGSTE